MRAKKGHRMEIREPVSVLEKGRSRSDGEPFGRECLSLRARFTRERADVRRDACEEEREELLGTRESTVFPAGIWREFLSVGIYFLF